MMPASAVHAAELHEERRRAERCEGARFRRAASIHGRHAFEA
jgi:hypothetical protein